MAKRAQTLRQINSAGVAGILQFNNITIFIKKFAPFIFGVSRIHIIKEILFICKIRSVMVVYFQIFVGSHWTVRAAKHSVVIAQRLKTVRASYGKKFLHKSALHIYLSFFVKNKLSVVNMNLRRNYFHYILTVCSYLSASGIYIKATLNFFNTVISSI